MATATEINGGTTLQNARMDMLTSADGNRFRLEFGHKFQNIKVEAGPDQTVSPSSLPPTIS